MHGGSGCSVRLVTRGLPPQGDPPLQAAGFVYACSIMLHPSGFHSLLRLSAVSFVVESVNRPRQTILASAHQAWIR